MIHRRGSNGIFHIVARVQTELPVKCPREGVYIGKTGIHRRVDDFDISAAELFCRFCQPVFSDILSRCKTKAVTEQPIRIPRGKQRCLRKIGQADLLRFVLFYIVLHPLDSQNLLPHPSQLLTGILYRAKRIISRLSLPFCSTRKMTSYKKAIPISKKQVRLR